MIRSAKCKLLIECWTGLWRTRCGRFTKRYA